MKDNSKPPSYHLNNRSIAADQLIGIGDKEELLSHLIVLIKTPGDFRERMSALTAFLQSLSGCEAVGIRLQAGEDYPYYETRGFPLSFVEAESRLCAHGENGEILRDGNGSPVLECMCGNILCGRFDPAKPFFTANGSFWTNSTTALLASTTEVDRQARTRNQCNGEGYESVALIPLRYEDQVLGLIQFNDHRLNRFTTDLIAHFESIASNLALVLSHRHLVELLRESEERFKAIYERAPMGVALIDSTSGRFLQANPMHCEITGYSRDEMLALDFMKITLPEDLQRDLDGMNSLRRGESKYYEIEKRCFRKDGTIVWVQLRVVPLIWKNGILREHLAIISDITAQRRAEEESRLNESRLETLVDILQHPSETIQDFLDYALDQAIKLTASKIGYIYHYHEDRREFVLNTWSKEVMAQCAVAYPSSFYELDKTGIWGEAVRQRRPILINDYHAPDPLKKGYPEGHVQLLKFMTIPIFNGDRIVGVVGLANKETDYVETDILQIRLLMDAVWKVTEQKGAEEALRESQALTKAIVDSTPDMIWSVDSENFDLLSFNRGLSDYYLHRRGIRLFKGMHQHDLFTDQNYINLWRSLYQRALSEGSYTAEYVVSASSNILHLTFNLIERQGKVSGISVFGKDITEKKQADELKTKLEAQLQQAQKMDSVGRLAGGIAHDFNNMLGIVIGHSEMALSQIDPNQPLHEDLTEIRNAAERSADLTRQLLAFARRQTIVPRILDVNETVAGMLNMLRRLIGENISLNWHPSEYLWPVKLDPGQIDQILANLCVNARDAIEGVGKITIETQNSTLDETYCAAHTGSVPGEFIRLAVSDDGCGMNKETLAQIFEPFFTTKGIGKGTGLGLSTVYGIVKQNRGFIDVFSKPGKGSTFRIYFPRHVGKAEQIAGTDDATEHDLRGHETILLVEDDLSLLKLVKKLLEQQGYTILAASSPGEAIRISKEHSSRIHLLMTDVVMPEMNGRDLTKNLRSLYPHIKSVFMSGYTADIIASNGVLDEGVHFIQKPFTLESLTAKIREVLDQA